MLCSAGRPSLVGKEGCPDGGDLEVLCWLKAARPEWGQGGAAQRRT